VPGRGTVAIGTLQSGIVLKGADAELLGYGNQLKTAVSDIQVFHKSVPRAIAGENVGILLRGIKREFVDRGMFLAPPGRLHQSNRFTARLYVLTHAEGGRSKPLTSGYINMAHVDTWTMAACVRLSDRPMAMPGDLVDSAEVLLRKPMVLRQGQRFVVRDNQRTTISGVVIELLTPSQEEITGFNFVASRPYTLEGNASTVMRRRLRAKTPTATPSVPKPNK
jgi:elongation factor Tu